MLCISANPRITMNGIKRNFKLKGDKAEEPTMYLGAGVSKITNEAEDICWEMLLEKYCRAAVQNIEDDLKKVNRALSSKWYTPLSQNYRPELDVTSELKPAGVQRYQELIGILRLAVELGRVDILYKVSRMSLHLALPREGHLEETYHIFEYLKIKPKLRIMFDCSDPAIPANRFKRYDWQDFYKDAKEAIPPNMPEPRG